MASAAPASAYHRLFQPSATPLVLLLLAAVGATGYCLGRASHHAADGPTNQLADVPVGSDRPGLYEVLAEAATKGQAEACGPRFVQPRPLPMEELDMPGDRVAGNGLPWGWDEPSGVETLRRLEAGEAPELLNGYISR